MGKWTIIIRSDNSRVDRAMKKNSIKKGGLLKAIIIPLISTLSLSSPANAQNTGSNNQKNKIELTNNKNNPSIPYMYKDKIGSIIQENLPIVEIDGVSCLEATANFVQKEMESDRGISKSNQLLFIYSRICEVLSGESSYKGLDNDSKRLEEFEKAYEHIDALGEKYKNLVMPFIEKRVAEARQQSAEYDRQSAEAKQQSAEAKQQSAEAKQQSAEAKQQSAEAKQQSAEAKQQSAEAIETSKRATYKGLDALTGFYDHYVKHPNETLLGDIIMFKKNSKRILENCKAYEIDIIKILKEKSWDEKKIDGFFKFYEADKAKPTFSIIDNYEPIDDEKIANMWYAIKNQNAADNLMIALSLGDRLDDLNGENNDKNIA